MEAATMATILFVYGTLKSGQRNNRLLAGQRFLRPAVTEPRYRLYDLGPYPGMVEDDETGVAVKGELWEVGADCLGELDDYEEVPDLFIRQRVAVQGRDDRVEAYFYDRTLPFDARSGDEWPVAGS